MNGIPGISKAANDAAFGNSWLANNGFARLVRAGTAQRGHPGIKNVHTRAIRTVSAGRKSDASTSLATARVEAAQSRAYQAGLRPNPMIGFTADEIGTREHLRNSRLHSRKSRVFSSRLTMQPRRMDSFKKLSNGGAFPTNFTNRERTISWRCARFVRAKSR